MAKAETESFSEMILEVETDTEGQFAKLCGLLDVTITRSANIDTTEVPDCGDESKPLYIDKEIRSLDVKISCTAVWSKSSNPVLMDWFYGGVTKNIRLTHAAASVGDPSIETGPAFISTLEHKRTKGQKVSASLDLEMNGLPTVTDAVAP